MMCIMTIYQRLSINLNKDCADIVRSYMADHQVSATETVRRAIGVFGLIEAGRSDGGQVYIEDRDGTRARIKFLY